MRWSKNARALGGDRYCGTIRIALLSVEDPSAARGIAGLGLFDANILLPFRIRCFWLLMVEGADVDPVSTASIIPHYCRLVCI